jgi:hypothetical protein
MSTFKEHCAECGEKLGKDWDVVHRWLDEFVGQTSPTHIHRVYRHHTSGVEQIRRKWGNQAAEAARLHIMADMAPFGFKNVPTVVEIEQLFKYDVVHQPDGSVRLIRNNW